MIESWTFINGERIMFPVSSEQAEQLGWTKVRLLQGQFTIVEPWLKANVPNRAYFIGAYAVYFYRECDANWFVLRWS